MKFLPGFNRAHSSRKPLAPENRRVALAWLALFTVGAAIYLALLLKHNSWFAGGPDSSGYCTEAQMIASGHMALDVTLLRELKLPPQMTYVVTPLGWARGSVDGFIVPTYPAGVPLHQALLGKFFGWSRAPFLVAPLLAFLSLFVCIALLREFGLPMAYACGGAAIFAAIPTLVNHAVQPVSDVVATFYSMLAIWLALRSQSVAPAILPAEDKRAGRIAGATLCAALAGLAFSIGVWVRPTNFLLALPLAFALRWRIRPLVACAIGALPAGIALGWWNKTLYGSPFRTGYGSISEVIKPHPVCGVFHIESLGQQLSPLVALGALFVFFDRRLAGWLRLLLGVWIGSFLLFYSFYDFCDERFLLPAMPALIVGFIAGVKRAVDYVGEHAPIFAHAVGALVIATVVTLQGQVARDLRSIWPAYDDRVFPTSIAFAEARLPKDALVLNGLMGGPFLYYSHRFTIRFDQVPIDGRLAVLREAAKRAHRPWYALLSSGETTPEEFKVWAPARWLPVGMNRDVTLWKLED